MLLKLPFFLEKTTTGKKLCFLEEIWDYLFDENHILQYTKKNFTSLTFPKNNSVKFFNFPVKSKNIFDFGIFFFDDEC